MNRLPTGPLDDRVQDALAIMAAAGLSVRPLAESDLLWRDTLAGCSYVPVSHTLGMLRYQQSYLEAFRPAVADLSVLLLHDGRVAGLWPLCLSMNDAGAVRIGSNEGPILPPLFVAGLALKSEKRLISQTLDWLDVMAASLPGGSQEFSESVPAAALSPWHQELMQRGAGLQVSHELYVDLGLSMEELRSRFRKSYRALINSGSRHWKVGLLTEADTAVWDEFRLLHVAVAGRSTRPLDTWQAQLDAIAAGDAFLVHLRDGDGRMVGGGLFHVSATEGLYAVGAYDRSLFDKPLGHVIQSHAMQEMQRRGLAWYKIGARPFPGDTPAPSDKELAIARFKAGFATHHFLRLHGTRTRPS